MTSSAGSASTPMPRRRARNSLSQGEILAAALTLTETDGLTKLSMPALARNLGCATMSIYKYFRNKDELLDALARRVMRDLHRRLPPAGDGTWDVELVAYFCAYRDLMEDAPAYREVVLYAPTSAVRAALTPAQLRRLDTGIGILHRAGLTLNDAVRVYNVYYNFTRSYVAYEHTVRAAASDRPDSDVASTSPLEAADYPLLAALPNPTAAIDVDEDGFRLGLELLTAGISRTYGIR